jgi:hypothetical protein
MVCPATIAHIADLDHDILIKFRSSSLASLLLLLLHLLLLLLNIVLRQETCEVFVIEIHVTGFLHMFLLRLFSQLVLAMCYDLLFFLLLFFLFKLLCLLLLHLQKFLLLVLPLLSCQAF